jgi:hypothetical protein
MHYTRRNDLLKPPLPIFVLHACHPDRAIFPEGRANLAACRHSLVAAAETFFPDLNFLHLGFSLFFLVLWSSQHSLSVRSVLNLSLQLRDSRSIPSKNLL